MSGHIIKKILPKQKRSDIDPKVIRHEEWNFIGVPENEREACFWYEYGREFFTQSMVLQGFRKKWLSTLETKKAKRDLESAKAIDLLSMRPRDNDLNIEDYDGYSMGEFPTIEFDFFPEKPWRDLHGSPQAEFWRKRMVSDVKEWADQDFASVNCKLKMKIISEADLPNRSLSKFKEINELFAGPNIDLANREYGFFVINWKFKDAPIIEAFKTWLTAGRLKRSKAGLPEAKSKVSRGGFADRLNWLGALRIKNTHSKKHLVYPDGVELKVDVFYNRYSELLEAASKAENLLQKLFTDKWNQQSFLGRHGRPNSIF